MKKMIFLSKLILALIMFPTQAFITSSLKSQKLLSLLLGKRNIVVDEKKEGRRKFLSSFIISNIFTLSGLEKAWAEENIAERASRLAREVENSEAIAEATKTEVPVSAPVNPNMKTIYDFSLPVAGKETPISDLVGSSSKAILVVNIKQDDPLSRKNIPGLIYLASK